MSSSVNGKSTAGESGDGQLAAADQPVIEIQNLSRLFKTTKAVDDLSFRVHPGQVFGFIGPNGAGKTTTMRILATLDTPTSGHAWVDGFSVVDDPDRVRRRLGFMPDGFGTYPNVDCEEYLDFFARSYGLRGAERRNALKKVMEFTQLDRLARKPVDGLSKGMKQRLCLGRALIHDPSVLILDEPAAGLDPRARIELREMIVALAADGKALLISSHILTELAEMCDRVAIIEKGKLLAVGTVDEILSGSPATSLTAEANATVALSKTCVVEIGVLSDLDQAEKFLESKFNDAHVSRQSNRLALEIEGDENVHADLLESMINHGIRVSRFAVKERSLEDAFLKVTKGLVQ